MTLTDLRAFVAANYPGLTVHQFSTALAIKHGDTVVCFLGGSEWEEGVKARINDGLAGCARKLRKQADALAGMVRA